MMMNAIRKLEKKQSEKQETIAENKTRLLAR